MTLERTLTELETLVEYGCGYLLSRNIKNIHPLDILPQMHQSDVLTYTIGNFSFDEILDEMDLSNDGEIEKWVRSNKSIGEIGYMTYDVKNYVAENWDVDDIFDDDDIKDYVKDNFDVDDVYDDEDIEDRARDMVDDLSLNEFIDMKGMGDTDILNTIDTKTLYDYVTDNFALADWVQWKDECTSYVNG